MMRYATGPNPLWSTLKDTGPCLQSMLLSSGEESICMTMIEGRR